MIGNKATITILNKLFKQKYVDKETKALIKEWIVEIKEELKKNPQTELWSDD